ncbi:N-substituted formamide deformylase [Arenibacter antarcticus]|uniref:Amidohydrolase n=1 Tax=Arenibacter antarcticus TaxID=2040469 RepID=A0ABW5VD84_9FLAO|nr:amidohydrolase [Arenibacter sp. H213]MCM4169597.1 amidohydrolase [Arenibacter sp. H213]
MKQYLLIGLGLLGMACEVPKEQADLIVLNANIYTVDDSFSKASAFAVKDGKFIGVGSSEEIEKKYSSDQIMNLEGKTIVPGLIDAHCHFYGLGLNQQVVDLSETTSFQEILDKVTNFQDQDPKDFIVGRGWDQNDWEVKEFPTKEKLDLLFPDTPVALRRIDGHALLVNQKALDMAGITKTTKAVGGEIILRNGEMTGVLVDGPMELVDAIIPKPNRDTKIAALKKAEEICLDNGLTTVNDAGLDRSTIELIDSLQQTGALSIRVYAMVSASQKNLDYYLPKGIMKTDKLNVGSFKVYGDGALGSRGAALREPYSDQAGHFGAMVTPVATIGDIARQIAASDYQMNTHAIGDSANIAVLRAYKEALQGKTDRRWKIEHAQIITPQDFDFFAEGIIPSVQPTHATSDMYWAEDRIGEDRLKGAYAYSSLLNKAGVIALGTDFPVEQVSPFLTFYAAVARKDVKNFPENGFQIKEALSREETLKGMTIWAAFSNFEESEKGSISVNKFADFTVLSDDIMTVPLQEIPQIKAEKTFIGGKTK